MDPAMIGGLGLVGMLFALFLLILAILWFMMPFLIMGTNGRLDRIIKQNSQIIELLEHARTQ